MEKALIDIRYYASDSLYETGKSLPSSCSSFFKFPKLLHYWGARIATILGANGLSLGEFDHLYVTTQMLFQKARWFFPIEHQKSGLGI